MFACAQEPKELRLVDGAAHVDLHSANPTEYCKRVVNFLDRHLRRGH